MLDRSLQHVILHKLSEAYPGPLSPSEMGFDDDGRAWLVNAMYLHEHQLIEAMQTEMLGEGLRVHEATITARGLDFLQDDGGLSAILGVVTVRFEADTLKAILAARIEASALPDADKSKLRKWLDDASGEMLKAGAVRLLNAALDRAPEAIGALLKLLS